MDREMGQLAQGFVDIKENLVKQDTVLKEQNTVLKEISAKLDYTNGKVRNHEFWIKAVKWGAGIVCATAIMVTPYIVDYLSEKIADDLHERNVKDIQDTIEDILSTYEFDITK